MHGCTSGFMLVVNAEIDSMGGVIDTGVGISSKPSLQQSSDLEKTQAELRQTFTAAEKFRRELEFLQKGGDPLDLKPGNAASISFQSTSLTDRHLTSEAKGSFAITASPHGDSVESSGRLGATPSVCEPNSADNLMLFDGGNTTTLSKLDVGHVSKESGDSAVLELPKKSYKRRIRSRPNRDGARSSSNDAVPSRGGSHFPPFRHASNSKPKSPNELDGVAVDQSTLGPPRGPHPVVLDANVIQKSQENHQEQVDLTDSKCPNLADIEKSTEEVKIRHDDGNNGETIPTKVVDSESSCGQTGQRFDGYNNGNGLASKEVVNVEGNDLVAEKDDDKVLDIDKDKNEDASAIKEEESLKGSESSLQNELKNSVCTTSETERKPQASNEIVRPCADVAEQNACSQENLKLATKEHEDSILEEARIIEAKRKRIAELSVRTLPLERRLKSQWDFVLEEMSWLANDFAQERLWKVTAAAQISKRVAFSSRIRFQKQSSLQKQKEVAHTLSEAVMQFWQKMQVKREESDSQLIKDNGNGIQGYARRFLEYNSSKAQYKSTQAPLTPDLGIMDLSWEDNLTEENLFYTVPPGAIEAYRKAIESHLLQFERTGSSMQEEVDTSGYDAVAENAYEEDEGETNTYYLPGGFEGHKATKAAQKRRKNFKIYGGRSYEMGGDVSFMQTGGTQPSVLSGKRPATSLNVSIPTKRMRTASRQRIISPFHAGTSGCVQPPHRTDASSGDTNSFQDEQSSLHGGSQIPNNMEAESVGDYEKQLQFDSMEVSNRPKKKKKGSTFDHRWQLDSSFQNDQKDHSRRRLDTHQFDSNGSSVASQMSNMSNQNKIMKLLVRDRGRKAKALKTPVGQPGSGSPWSLFEDQALVVLVHDMGPNWELISDAINSTLQFKCIFRKSKECKERHKILMDRNTGDGADSAEDSGNSQPYPSTLPGIPEGSARQLFQRLQGPMEEDTLKSHFEKIIMIGHKQHYRRTQNDNQDPKQLQQPHSSHAFALSQVIPNNLNGGPVLTPLELSEPISSSPDALPVGFQGPGGLPGLNHGTAPPMLPGSSHSAPGSSNSVHGTNLPSVSAPLNPAVREGRYGIPRAGSLSVDDQQKMQHYNQMLSARNANQSSLPPGSHSVTDRGVRMLPAGSGMGVMCGMNRGIKMARPSMMNSGSMLTSGTPTSTSGQGNSMLRTRDAVHMIRPNTDHQKMAVADAQMQQVSQSGTTQGVPPLPPVQSYPLHHHGPPPRPISPQQSPRVLTPNSHHPHHFQGATNPAFGMRFAKERQLQQQRLRQQQFSTTNPMTPHVQPPDPQLPASSPQNNTPQSSSPQVSIPLPQKHPVLSPHGIIRNPQTNQIAKQQRPRQQFQQPERLQPKLMKAVRGPALHQNLPSDSPLLNGFTGGQSSGDKGEQKVMHHMMYSGKQSVSPHSSLSQPHQQIQATSSKQLQQQKVSDNTPNQNHTSSNNLQKLANQKQVIIAPQKLLLNKKVSLNPVDRTESPSTPVTMPPSNDANSSETPAVADNDKKSVRLSPPQTGGAGSESEHADQVAVHRQSSLDRNDTGIEHSGSTVSVDLSFPCKSNLQVDWGKEGANCYENVRIG
ncbi:hypothetical protein L2E82_12945 [Cichorium intybus]|uniref:Uncharacterized protein n=1 Tax=Cichorium intybus TaxID=13427 RepID=A0ACB9GHE2_CICIN|nr:hypothetical protein L2E82_12945 [Cichorium intybus]